MIAKSSAQASRRKAEKAFLDSNTKTKLNRLVYPEKSTPNSQQRDRSSKDRQLGLLPDNLPLTSIYATRSQCKQPGGDRWWNIRCGYNQRMFGGLYSTAERDKFLTHFKGRRDEIGLNEFAIVAERIIAETYQWGVTV